MTELTDDDPWDEAALDSAAEQLVDRHLRLVGELARAGLREEAKAARELLATITETRDLTRLARCLRRMACDRRGVKLSLQA